MEQQQDFSYQPNQFNQPNPSAASGGGLAIASLVLGIVSMLTCGGFLILPIIGFILGLLSLKSNKQGIAITGTVLSGVSFLLFFMAMFLSLLLLPAVQAAREAARRMQCSNQLKQIAIASHNFHDTYNALPPLYTVDEEGKPLHSWRVLILPFIGENTLYQQIRLDEPWDSEYNKQFHSQMPKSFACPSYKVPSPDRACCYSAIAGKTAKGLDGVFSLAEKAGITQGAELRSITDGTSNTLLVIEVKIPFCWMDTTADIDFDDLSKGMNVPGGRVGSCHSGGCNAAFCDTSVRFFSRTISSDFLIGLGTRNGGESIVAP